MRSLKACGGQPALHIIEQTESDKLLLEIRMAELDVFAHLDSDVARSSM